MAHTNSTENYGLPQWIGTDKPTFLGDFNSAFAAIDTAMKANSDTATAASATANAADAVASSAAANATNAIGIANNAASEAATATSAAASATQIANTAKTTADSALHASAANSIENLAPAYDNTLTYNVGDLVTYIDAQNSGKLYKCIVAVNTPMEFNINYWDDVTTSEVYAKKLEVISEVVSDGVKTFTELLNGLFPASVDFKKEYKLIITNDSTYAGSYEPTYTGTANIDFYGFNLTNSGLTVIRYSIASVNSSVQRAFNDYTSTTYTNTSTDVPESGIHYILIAG